MKIVTTSRRTTITNRLADKSYVFPGKVKKWTSFWHIALAEPHSDIHQQVSHVNMALKK
jgi:hypothetical protein